MSCCNEFDVCLESEATNTLRFRFSAENASGESTGEPGRGNWLLPGDVSSIECWAYDLDSITPNTPIFHESLHIPTCVLAEPQDWEADDYGYNMRHNLPPEAVPTGGHTYLLKYLTTLVDGYVTRTFVRGKATKNPGDETE